MKFYTTFLLYLLCSCISAQHDGGHDGGDPPADDGYSVDMTSIPSVLQASVPSEIIFTVRDPSGNPVTYASLAVEYTKKLHSAFVGENGNVFGHVHPEDFGTPNPVDDAAGRFKVNFTFPQSGRYIAGVGFNHQGKNIMKGVVFSVQGAPSMQTGAKDLRNTKLYGYSPLPSNDRFIDSVVISDLEIGAGEDGYKISLTHAEGMISGECYKMNFHLENNTNSAPITDLSTFLESAAHIIIVSSDLAVIEHIHGSAIGDGNCGEHAAVPSTPFGPDIAMFHEFPAGNTYHIIAQIDHGGNRMIIASFTVDVEDTATLLSASYFFLCLCLISLV